MIIKKIDCADCDIMSDSLLNYAVEEDLEKINCNKICNSFKKGQTLFYEGNQPAGLMCINKGKVKLFRTGRDGKEQILGFGLSGDFLGYRALIADEPYVSSASALEDTIVCLIKKEDFLSMLQQNSHISKQLMISLCKELGLAQEKIQSMSQKTVRERLAETLLYLKDTFASKNLDNSVPDIILPREDLANIVGTSNETLSRTLSDFKNEKLVEFEGKKIRIINENKLRSISGIETSI
ncbi:Crp/Fnr family transcriptional regulator [soil metagenome]